jgi:hypothetical protein
MVLIIHNVTNIYLPHRYHTDLHIYLHVYILTSYIPYLLAYDTLPIYVSNLSRKCEVEVRGPTG